MIVQLILSERQVKHLQQLAILDGFKRENPRKRWTVPEVKEAVRYALLRASRTDQFAAE
jgi:hypothetical protein